jgi:hypothetical protein
MMNVISPAVSVGNQHSRPAQYNRRRMAFDQPNDWQAGLDEERDMRLVEGRLIEALRRHVAPLLADVPDDADGVMR